MQQQAHYKYKGVIVLILLYCMLLDLTCSTFNASLYVDPHKSNCVIWNCLQLNHPKVQEFYWKRQSSHSWQKNKKQSGSSLTNIWGQCFVWMSVPNINAWIFNCGGQAFILKDLLSYHGSLSATILEIFILQTYAQGDIQTVSRERNWEAKQMSFSLTKPEKKKRSKKKFSWQKVLLVCLCE